MHSNFAAAGKAARAAIDVPSVPWNEIRRKSNTPTLGGRLRTFVICSLAGIAAIAGAAAAEMHGGIRVWLFGDGARVSITSFAIEKMPQPAQLRAIAEKATFRVIFPMGLPASTRLVRIIYAPLDRPNAVDLQYWNAKSHAMTNLLLVDSKAVATGDLPLRGTARNISSFHHWQLGDETVFGGANSERVRAAMEATSPAESVAANEAMLSSIRVLGGSFETAELAGSLASSGVLIDPQNLVQIASLAKAGKPLLATRATYLTNIPTERGEPQYGKATLNWLRDVAVSANGVRAISSVLKRAPECGRNARCSILYVPDSSAYTIWTIPASGSPRGYSASRVR